MKKLLHLYNYGHIPFPKLGRGGLGYHLPQYKIRGKGIDKKQNKAGDITITEDSDNESVVIESDSDFEDDYDDVDNDYIPQFREEDEIIVELNHDNAFLNDRNTKKEMFIDELSKYEEFEDEDLFKYTKPQLIDALVTLANDGNHDDLRKNILYDSNEYDDEKQLSKTKRKSEPKFMTQISEEYYPTIKTANEDAIKKMNTLIEEIIITEKPKSKTTNLYDLYDKKFGINERALFKASTKLKSTDKYAQRVYDERFKKLFLFNDRLTHNGKPVFKEGRIQNVFQSGKDLESRIKNNIPLMNAVIKQIYGDDWNFNGFRNVTENKNSNFDLYITIINTTLPKNNQIMNINVEIKKYDDDEDIRNIIKRSRDNFVSYVTTKLLDLGIFDIQENINIINEDDDSSDLEKKELLEPLLKERYNIYKHVVKNFNKNYNKDFSFKDKNFFTMKRTKIPQISKKIIDENSLHDPVILKNIRLMQKDGGLSKPKAIEEANHVLGPNNDTLFMILKNGAFYSQSYKHYLMNFLSDEYDPKHIANVAQIVFDQYDAPKKDAIMAQYNSFGLNSHNMVLIDTSNVPPIPDTVEKAILNDEIKKRKLKLKLT